MAINFPNNPAINDTYQSGDVTWRWDGTTWNLVPQMQPAVIGDTPPANPTVGQFWWSSKLGQLYLWYDDGNTRQWVQAAGSALPYGGDLNMLGNDITNVDELKVNRQLSVGPTATTHEAGSDTLAFVDGRVSTIMGLYNNCYYDGANYKAIKTGWAHTLTLDMNSGSATLGRSSVSMTPGGNITWNTMFTFNTSLEMTIPSNLYCAAVLSSGHVWAETASAGAAFGFTLSAPYRIQSYTGSWYWSWHTSTGDLNWISNGQHAIFRGSDKSIIMSGPGFKPGGGPWTDSSDERIKNVKGAYDPGLDEVLQLNPVRYTFIGNDTRDPPENIGNVDPDDNSHLERSLTAPYENSMHYTAAVNGTEFVGLIAQEVEVVFPDMVTKREGYIYGTKVDDIRDIDTANLIYALVNSIKELNARIAALEAGR